MAFEPLADAPPASFPIHHVKQPSFFGPGSSCVRVVFLPLLSFVAADPRARGVGGAPRDVQPCTCRAVTRDATLARRWYLPRNQEACLTALRRGVVGPGPASVPVAGSGAKAPRHQPLWAGCGAGLFVSAVTSRGRRHNPLRLQDRF